MIIVLNGPLGIGKSTLAEALMESIDRCVFLDGDHLVATNPPPHDREAECLHSIISLLVAHHRRAGYQHFVINHLWRTRAELDDLRSRLRAIDQDMEIRCFLLRLPLEENLRRVIRRERARAVSELDFEVEILAEELAVLDAQPEGDVGEPFDVSGAPGELVVALKRYVGLP